MKNASILVLIAALLAVGAYAFYGDRLEAPAAADVYTRGDVAWRFDDEGEDPVALAPRTRVWLLVRGAPHDLGVRRGSCAAADAASLEGDEIAAATCWFAGAGDEFRVSQPAPGELVVEHREVGEPTAEGPAAATQFRAVLSI